MKYAVRYTSRGGNTKAVAELIAQEAGVEALRVFEPLTEEVDVLFLGAGVWFMNVTKEMKEFLAHLDKNRIKKIVVFSTSADLDSATKVIKGAANRAGIPVDDRSLTLKLGFQGFSLMAPAGGDLKPAQVQKVKEFADQVLTN